MKTPQSIQIIGKRWFDKANGNTYFSSVGIVDGKPAVSINFEYGYGDQYEYETAKLLHEAGHIDLKYEDSDRLRPIWQYARDNNVLYYKDVTDVKRKKDLVF